MPVVRDIEVIEEELVGIATIQDDLTKLERLLAWSSVHPDEVVYAIRFLSGRTKGIDAWIQQHSTDQGRTDQPE
ncbi:MAG TPA: hypothetical protein VH351_23550 [Bryobacteraceae bacterium]|jgi:hypothetical protein|nr:hypothetical protein [Bryobacteraceae bacterium]